MGEADGLFVCDERGRVCEVNEAACRLLGRPRQELIGASLDRLCGCLAAEETRRFLGEPRDGESLRVGGLLRDKGGAAVKVLCRLHALRIDGRRYTAALVNADSSPADGGPDDARFMQALASSESRLRAIVDTAVDAILTIDEAGRIESANSAVHKMFGYTPEELRGRDVAVLIPSPYSDRHADYLAAYLKSGIKKIIGVGREVMGRRKDGSTFPLHLAVSETTIGESKVFTGILRDLSEMKGMQEEVIQSRSLAAIGETAAVIAHEIKNPLAALSGPIQVLRDEVSAADPRREVLQAMLEQVRRLDDIVRQLLLLARPWVPKKEPCHLGELVQRVVAMAREQSLFSGVRFSVEEEESLHAMVDPALFEQVLWNLLLNAVQAMPKGGDVRVSFFATPDEIRLRVEDTGAGMPADVQAKIFRPFFSTKPSGTGLGLSICRKIMEAHGGAITIQSDAGRGTVAMLRVPRR
ncbi:MAG: PAS domain S-box protein [Planctomycetes bacterium]|nr:PAS domain S-box protein [Planctomycetota bacterium]